MLKTFGVVFISFCVYAVTWHSTLQDLQAVIDNHLITTTTTKKRPELQGASSH